MQLHETLQRRRKGQQRASGRWMLTLIAGLLLAYGAFAATMSLLPAGNDIAERDLEARLHLSQCESGERAVEVPDLLEMVERRQPLLFGGPHGAAGLRCIGGEDKESCTDCNCSVALKETTKGNLPYWRVVLDGPTSRVLTFSECGELMKTERPR